MIAAARLDDAIRIQVDENMKELSALCAVPSVSAIGTGLEDCADLLVSMLRRRGFETRILAAGGPPVVFAQREGQADRTLLFYNHYDVQPPEPLELWDTPPFEASLREGKLFARGVSDNKGHILCRLAAVDAWLEIAGELPCNIKFIIEGEEEVGSPHLHELIKQHGNLLAADGCIWEFGGVNHEGKPELVAGLRGIIYVELRVETASRDAHSGLGGSIFPNAAWRLTWALASLKGPDERIRLPGFYDKVIPPSGRDLELLSMLPEEAQSIKHDYGLSHFLKGLTGGVELRREMIFSPSCTVCGLTSGYQGPGSKTVLPAQASAKVGFRLVPNQSPGEVLEQLRAHLETEGFNDMTVTELGSVPPGRTDPDHPFLKLVAECAEPVYGMPQLIDPMSGGSGPIHPFIEVLGLPVATAGVGYPGSNAHAPNENIVIDHYVDGVRHTARIMEALART